MCRVPNHTLYLGLKLGVVAVIVGALTWAFLDFPNWLTPILAVFIGAFGTAKAITSEVEQMAG